MTNEEAVKLLKDGQLSDSDVDAERFIEAYNMAIKALEQQPCEDWYDVPSNEMTLEQARQAVKDLRKKLAEYLEQEPCDNNWRFYYNHGYAQAKRDLSCDDCISRQAVLSYICNDLEFGDEENGCDLERKIAQEEIYNFIKKMPSVTPKEKTGHWIEIKNSKGTVIALRCSHCGNSPKRAISSDFCPNCGARMVSE